MKLRRMIGNILAVASTFALVGTFSACETNTPEVEIKIEFNKKSYTLSYEMNRKITPKTVEHFITLAEKKFYTDTCVHNYTSTKLYTGAYEWNADNGLVYKDYYGTMKNYIPKSVWQDEGKTVPTYTLYGEFEENKFEVASGSLKESFGSLVMYYTDKGEDVSVSIEKNDGSGMASRNYTENSATSQFYISLASTSTTNKNYCVFATLDSDSVSTLKSLQSAISKYIEDNYGTEEDSKDQFTTSTEITIDEDDTVLTDYENDVTYAVPNEPIIIKSVTVTKY